MNKKPLMQRFLSVMIFLLFISMSQQITRGIPPVPQQIITVDISGTGTYTSIQDAINHAATTDIIQIQPGTYYENTIIVDKKIDIVGASQDKCIINCTEKSGIIVLSSYVTISHLQITNTKNSAISIESGFNGCAITSCDIRSITSGNGIDILSSYNTVSQCTIVGVMQLGQALKIQGNFNTINDSTLQHFSNGVLVIDQATNNKILNCNIFDNENAIDIRMNSYNNVITNCNIYSNLQGIKIWQNSNNNTINLNNIFKNDIHASDDASNQWDNGSVGNYWDIYQGIDANHDHIGDSPFVISEKSTDRFPHMTMFLPNIIIAPTSIRQTTSTSDPTPTFTWDSVIYDKDIVGYGIKIDADQEIIINTTTWTSPANLTNGVHFITIRAIGSDGQSSLAYSLQFTVDSNFNDLDHDGWSDEEETLYGTDPNNSENYPLDTDNDHIPDSVDNDDDNDGYPDEMEISYDTNMKDSNSHPKDTDSDLVPDENSPDGKYEGDIDKDDDGLINSIELQLGSDPTNRSDAKKIYLRGNPSFLVDTSQDGIYDILYNPSSGTTNAVKYNYGIYQIDVNGDDTWDYTYNTIDNSVTSSQEPPITLPLILLLFGVIIAVLVIIIFFYRKGKSHPPKKQLREFNPSSLPIDSETQEMVTETRTLLYRIQQNVNSYIEKLNEIKTQIPALSSESEYQQPAEKKIVTKEFEKPDESLQSEQQMPSSKSEYDDVHCEIDKLFETLHRKNT